MQAEIRDSRRPTISSAFNIAIRLCSDILQIAPTMLINKGTFDKKKERGIINYSA